MKNCVTVKVFSFQKIPVPVHSVHRFRKDIDLVVYTIKFLVDLLNPGNHFISHSISSFTGC